MEPVMELSQCPQCGLPAEVQRDGERRGEPVPTEMVKVLCIGRHWFYGLRERLVA